MEIGPGDVVRFLSDNDYHIRRNDGREEWGALKVGECVELRGGIVSLDPTCIVTSVGLPQSSLNVRILNNP